MLLKSQLRSSAILRSGWWQFFTDVRGTLSVPYSRAKKMGPIGCRETSVRNYHFSLRDNSEERSSHPLRGGSLK